MSRSKKKASTEVETKVSRNASQNRKKGARKDKDRTSNRSSNVRNSSIDIGENMPVKTENNLAEWYIKDKMLAEQVSQISFQNLAGYPFKLSNNDWNVPNVVRVLLNPCPGVIKNADKDSPMLNKTSGINLAGYRLFSKLSAYTGRTATYGPQDISTMILAFGEVISCLEWCRRAFGLANAMSMRNRSYPRDVINWALLINDDDFFKNYATYRTRFNSLITMINQLPIPKGISYFDKCASLYEKVFLDAPSSMAQSVVPSPFSTWILDESSDPRGTILNTFRWCCNATWSAPASAAENFSFYLDQLDKMIGALLNSTSLQVVYTDLLNLANKVGQEFWRFDYVPDGYLVIPEYNLNYLLQWHNSTTVGVPDVTTEVNTSTWHVTPYNNVVPNPNLNTLYYNPGFYNLNQTDNGRPRTGEEALIDMINDNPTVEERIDVTRYTSISGTTAYTSKLRVDAVLPDHYVVSLGFRVQAPTWQALVDNQDATVMEESYYIRYAGLYSTIDWAPHIYAVADSDHITFERYHAGDLNYYTTVTAEFLRNLHQFMALGLYDIT